MGNETTIGMLRNLMGHIENGTDVVITLSQDDATGVYVVRCSIHGKTLWTEYADKFDKAIEVAYAAHGVNYGD